MPGDNELEGTVLIVDDEENVADLYADYLRDACDVLTAYGGQEGMELLSSEVDVALVDRQMPVVSGAEVVATIEDRRLDARVALVTAKDPDFDIVDMGIDDYLTKPVTRGELCDTVERLLAIEAYNERVRALSARRVKRNVLAVEKTASQLRDSEKYARLTADIERLEAELDEIEAGIGTASLERYI